MLVEHFGGRQVEIFLSDVDSSFSQSEHAGFGAYTFELGTRAAIHLLGNLLQIDSSGQIHAPRMDS